jgi:hypothetical protein
MAHTAKGLVAHTAKISEKWEVKGDRLAESARSCPYQACGGLRVCLTRLSDDEISAGW